MNVDFALKYWTFFSMKLQLHCSSETKFKYLKFANNIFFFKLRKFENEFSPHYFNHKLKVLYLTLWETSRSLVGMEPIDSRLVSSNPNKACVELFPTMKQIQNYILSHCLLYCNFQLRCWKMLLNSLQLQITDKRYVWDLWHIVGLLCKCNNLQLSEPGVRAQLDMHGLHRQTSRCRGRQREWKKVKERGQSIMRREQSALSCMRYS